MRSRCNGSILLGTIAICVALIVTEPDINVKKPFGCKMCDRFCNQIVGCFSYIYRTIDLSCDPIQAKSSKQKPGRGIYYINATKDKERINADNAAKCNQGWKMFENKRGIIKCRPILSSHPILPTIGEEKEFGMTRILILPRTHSALRQQLYIDNNSVVEYPFLRNINIQSVAYISSQRKLVVSSVGPEILFFTPIDEQNKTIIKTDIITISIAIDDHKQLMFMKLTYPIRSVSVMSTDSKNITSLFSHGNVCSDPSGGLIADHKRSLIYLLCPGEKILHFTYQGVSKGKIGDRTSIYAVFCLDMPGHVLYYQDRKFYFHKLSLSDHTDTTIHTVQIQALHTMLTLDNILYVRPMLKGHLLVVNMSDMGSVTKINIAYKRRIVMCLIP